MKTRIKWMGCCLAGVLVFGLAACKEKGPMEKAGESVDKAAEDVKDAVSEDGPMEKAGESIDKAVEDVTK